MNNQATPLIIILEKGTNESRPYCAHFFRNEVNTTTPVKFSSLREVKVLSEGDAKAISIWEGTIQLSISAYIPAYTEIQVLLIAHLPSHNDKNANDAVVEIRTIYIGGEKGFEKVVEKRPVRKGVGPIK